MIGSRGFLNIISMWGRVTVETFCRGGDNVFVRGDNPEIISYQGQIAGELGSSVIEAWYRV